VEDYSTDHEIGSWLRKVHYFDAIHKERRREWIRRVGRDAE
jgi:hypothetical protein